MSTKIRVRNSPIEPLVWLSSRASTPRRRRVFCGGAGTLEAMATAVGPLRCLLIGDPRVHRGVEEVDDQVDEHELKGEDQHQPLDDGVITGVDRLDEEPAEAGEVEDRLDDDGA